jgi:hypothetical protein
MQLCVANFARRKPHESNALELSPAMPTELAPKFSPLANGEIHRYRLDVLDITD